MTSNPITLKPEEPLSKAEELMREHRIRHIPVIDGAELAGLITQRDILAAASAEDSLSTAADLMRKKVYTVSGDSDIRSAAILMQRHKIGCLPVVDEQQLVGIVTDSDYVSLAINLLEQLDEYEDDPDDDYDDLSDLEAYTAKQEDG